MAHAGHTQHSKMLLDLAHPELEISLPVDPFAPRAARYHVGQLDRPSPDLRDAVVLLSSELVTEAVERSSRGPIALRAWMPADVVRVEVQSPLAVEETAQPRAYGSLLLDQIADRWSIERSATSVCTWFEIDRHPAPRTGEHSARRELAGRTSNGG
jgi:hypothetical protein